MTDANDSYFPLGRDRAPNEVDRQREWLRRNRGKPAMPTQNDLDLLEASELEIKICPCHAAPDQPYALYLEVFAFELFLGQIKLADFLGRACAVEGNDDLDQVPRRDRLVALKELQRTVDHLVAVEEMRVVAGNA
ncbi:hypothetical protein C5L14_16800 [Labrys okinawensis]|uniref:Uncharacterized protein n=1 Tax=Labrys okinawensis TaxID=346911 RepID=A0A2S9QC64_9HYPH|nr:hypothetical protein [Labrys okinawensis]PRH86943.1 hypothetical protein C5L14_16800 [Labrys okinawensis]